MDCKVTFVKKSYVVCITVIITTSILFSACTKSIQSELAVPIDQVINSSVESTSEYDEVSFPIPSAQTTTNNNPSKEEQGEPVVFHDSAFESAFREFYHIVGPIYKSELLEIDNLTLQNAGIEDIADVELFENLIWLDLQNNNISDISPIKQLSKLEVLWLTNNNISNISALSELTNIYSLGLSENAIQNISFLKNLRALEMLSLSGNPIDDISVLKGMTKLNMLYLANTNVSDGQIAEVKSFLPAHTSVIY